MPIEPPKLLSSDLDGTLIPLEGELAAQHALAELKDYLRQTRLPLVYVTGRHLASIRMVASEYSLPVADWVIADVGTAIYRGEKCDYKPLHQYKDELKRLTKGMDAGQLVSLFNDMEGLRLQEDEKLGPYKLSYYVNASKLENYEIAINERIKDKEVPYRTISSVDPFNGDGLIDILPVGVSKAFALQWLSEYLSILPEEIIFSGDSGNDLAALVHGFRAILVGNASDELRTKVQADHRKAEWSKRLYCAKGHSTAGVWEGVKWYCGI